MIVLTCLAPFGLALAAAAIRRYPYGGVADGSPARVMQYLVPSICLLAGLGSATLLGLFQNPRRRLRAIRICLVVLAAIGVLPLAAEALHPFRSIHAQRARQFARQFWPDFVREAEPVCLRWDLGLGDWDSTNLNVAVYLCNQMIYAPAPPAALGTPVAKPSRRAGPCVACSRLPTRPIARSLPGWTP